AYGRVHVVQTLHFAARSLRLDGPLQSSLCARQPDGLAASDRAIGGRHAITKSDAHHLRLALPETSEPVAIGVMARPCFADSSSAPPPFQSKSNPFARHSRLVCRTAAEVQKTRGLVMLIGTMNHPGHDLLSEIEWMTAMGFD